MKANTEFGKSLGIIFLATFIEVEKEEEKTKQEKESKIFEDTRKKTH